MLPCSTLISKIRRRLFKRVCHAYECAGAFRSTTTNLGPTMSMSNRTIRKLAIAAVVLAAGLYFIPVVTLFFLATGLIDVMRNTRCDAMVFERYFLGNGIPTWLLSPFNLLIDLLSYRNKGVYKLQDLPPE